MIVYERGLAEADIAQLHPEELVGASQVLHLDVHHREPGGLGRLDLEHGLGPVVAPVLTPVLVHRVAELAPVLDLQVVPRHQ